MRLSTLESLGLLDSWALSLELLSNSDQKINEKKAHCFHSNRNIIHLQFSGFSVAIPMCDRQGCVGAGCITDHSTQYTHPQYSYTPHTRPWVSSEHGEGNWKLVITLRLIQWVSGQEEL